MRSLRKSLSKKKVWIPLLLVASYLSMLIYLELTRNTSDEFKFIENKYAEAIDNLIELSTLPNDRSRYELTKNKKLNDYFNKPEILEAKYQTNDSGFRVLGKSKITGLYGNGWFQVEAKSGKPSLNKYRYHYKGADGETLFIDALNYEKVVLVNGTKRSIRISFDREKIDSLIKKSKSTSQSSTTE